MTLWHTCHLCVLAFVGCEMVFGQTSLASPFESNGLWWELEINGCQSILCVKVFVVFNSQSSDWKTGRQSIMLCLSIYSFQVSSDWKTHRLHILVRWTRSCHSHTAPAIPEPQYYSHLMIIIYKPLTRTLRIYCLDKGVQNYHHNAGHTWFLSGPLAQEPWFAQVDGRQEDREP